MTCRHCGNPTWRLNIHRFYIIYLLDIASFGCCVRLPEGNEARITRESPSKTNLPHFFPGHRWFNGPGSCHCYDASPPPFVFLFTEAPLKAREEIFLADSSHSGMVTVKDLHSEKACAPISMTDSGILTAVNEVHPKKARTPIAVTVSGMVNLVKDLQSTKALTSISVTESGMIKLVKEVHVPKASRSITLTDSGIVTLVKDLQSQKANSEITMRDSGMLKFVKDLHPRKADGPIFVTDSGMLTSADFRTSPKS